MRTLNLNCNTSTFILIINSRMDNLNTTLRKNASLSLHSPHIILILTILRIRMHLLKPLHHLLPRSAHNTFDIQLLPRREAVAAMILDSGNRYAAGFGRDDICAAAGEEEGCE